MLLHQSLAGCVIGKGGSKIKELKDVSRNFFNYILWQRKSFDHTDITDKRLRDLISSPYFHANDVDLTLYNVLDMTLNDMEVVQLDMNELSLWKRVFLIFFSLYRIA